MKKNLLLATMFGLLLFLTACNGDTENDSESAEESSEEETAENTDETTDGADTESSDEASTLSADELIDEAQENWSGTESYELNQIYNISGEDDSDPIRTITTHSDQNELKVAINSNDVTTTHYIIDGEHYIYKDDELEFQEEALDMENSSYDDLLTQLDNFRSGEVSETDDGYTLAVQFENQDDISTLLTEEASELITEADDISGEMTLTFDDDFKYDGGELTGVISSDGEEYELSSNISIERIGNIPVIEKPSGM